MNPETQEAQTLELDSTPNLTESPSSLGPKAQAAQYPSNAEYAKDQAYSDSHHHHHQSQNSTIRDATPRERENRDKTSDTNKFLMF